MKLETLKSFFISQLSSQYSNEDLNVFFYILMEEYTHIEKIDLLSSPEMSIEEIVTSRLNNSIERLKKHEPVQYITGKSWFYDIQLNVSPDVLIPRPETEELVDLIIKDITRRDYQLSTINYQRIIDIGTGSGCIAIALKKNLPGTEVYALDISEKALAIAGRNACKNNTDVNFFRFDILNPSAFHLNLEPFDLIVSNPPYVRESEQNLMQPNVLQYEPHSALFVKDNDPLVFYKAISEFAKNEHLRNNGKLYFEINENLDKDVADLLKSKGFQNIIIKNDIFNKPRIITCQLIN
jgi:release factor glutamine methyltransferase